MINRAVVVVLDSVGIGQAPDAPEFGDFGVNTLGNISNTVGLSVPNMQKMGLGNISYLKTVLPTKTPSAAYGKMLPAGNGKDTLVGHWEMMGLTSTDGFKVFVENGFPAELIAEFEEKTGRKVLANKEANGMKVIEEYYDEHMATGSWIVYTSVDSTFQLAAHEDVIPLEELYKACEIIREMTKTPEYNLARVIARPFIGGKEDFSRTSNRHDYAIDPFSKTTLDVMKENNLDVIGIGKIPDIFNNHGITKAVKTKSNIDGVDKTIDELNMTSKGLIFTNLVEFDSVFGHPRDINGYKECLEEFDAKLPELLAALKEDDLLIITADHGNDPTYKGNDHTREMVPLLVYGKEVNTKLINDRMTFEDLGETICEIFNIDSTPNGTSFLNEIK